MNELRLINIGFGSLVAGGRLLAVVSPESAPVKRLIQDTRDRGNLVDATFGRRTRSVILMDSGHVVLSALQPETIAGRVSGKSAPVPAGGEDPDD